MRNIINTILTFTVMFSLAGCDESQAEKNNVNSDIPIETIELTIENKDILKTREDLIRGMLSYMESTEVSYTRADVAETEKILNNHYIKLRDIKTRNDAESLVKSTVIGLNHLNYKTDHELIETDQRELICEFIIMSGAMHGFNEKNEDVTEKWREW